MFATPLRLLCALVFVLNASAAVLWDGRPSFDFSHADLDRSVDPFLTVVKGSQNASHYTKLLGHSVAPTPLWGRGLIPFLPFPVIPQEQVLAVSVDNSSVFVPGGNPQYGFRRTDVIAQKDWSPANLVPIMETGTTVFHFSIKVDPKHPLDYKHEYQIVFIEPSDGSHVFGIQVGSPFTNPTGKLPAKDAYSLKVLDHAWNVQFKTPFTPFSWHNFAIQVDWEARSLAVFYSTDATPLKAVTKVIPNLTVPEGDAGKGDFHFGVLKLPLVNPNDTPDQQGDVVHYGIQPGTTDGLLYSGVFVEDVKDGVSLGGGVKGKPVRK